MNTKHVAYAPKPVQARLKAELHAWLHQTAVEQERSANWMLNKLVEEAKKRSEASREKEAASIANSASDRHSQESAQ